MHILPTLKMFCSIINTHLRKIRVNLRKPEDPRVDAASRSHGKNSNPISRGRLMKMNRMRMNRMKMNVMMEIDMMIDMMITSMMMISMRNMMMKMMKIRMLVT